MTVTLQQLCSLHYWKH